MTRALGIAAGAILVLLYASLLLVVMPAVQLRTGATVPEQPLPYTEQELAGRKHYISLGCVYCHSQQPRDPSQAPDHLRGWGRPSVPVDYTYDSPHLLGTMRTGPDLLNIGARQPSDDWHLVHLYQPRAVVPWSTMPAYPFLFVHSDSAPKHMDAIRLPPEYSVDGEYVVPTQAAIDLVAYLKALDRTYPVGALPSADPKETDDE